MTRHDNFIGNDKTMLTDSFNRKIDYLRLSVTDRCNLRCVYCLPEFYSRFTPSTKMMTNEEIVNLAFYFVELGISKIRITGGEPLVRPGICGLIGKLSKIEGITEISLSTNGILLNRLAEPLFEAGLKRVNISLDSLNPDKFRQITRLGKLESVLEGIDSAFRAGLNPIKLNVVVVRGMNEDEIGEFVKLTEEKPLHIRFIELMPIGERGFFSKERWVPLNEMIKRAQPLEPIPPNQRPIGFGPARYYRRPDAKGTVGFISALSCGFCQSCNRIRLSAKGVLIPCLDAAPHQSIRTDSFQQKVGFPDTTTQRSVRGAEEGTNLLTPLRSGAGKEAIKELILEAVRNKPEQHRMLEKVSSLSVNPRFMCQVGG